MAMRPVIGACALLLVVSAVVSAAGVNETQLPPTYLPTGQQMYVFYCAACHGTNAKGHGPAAAMLRTPPPDLTALSKRHLGTFPREYVMNVLEFGPGVPAHGSSDMPTWGPIFRYYDKQNERVVQQRIKRLCDYLASLQVR